MAIRNNKPQTSAPSRNEQIALELAKSALAGGSVDLPKAAGDSSSDPLAQARADGNYVAQFLRAIVHRLDHYDNIDRTRSEG